MAITKIPAAGFTGNNFRNIIINGDMSIAQRGTSASSITADGYHTMDRIKTELTYAGTWTQSQSTDVPTGQGFATSLKMDCTTANGSLNVASYGWVSQRFEGQNLQYLKFGTSSAQTLTASFWVKSNKTGTYICEFANFTSSKTQSQSYTISSSDTWEKKTLTFTGDTATTIPNTNARSFNLNFWLLAGTNYSSGTLNTSFNTLNNPNRAVGQVNLADNTANYINITGVQLEAGTTASDFEFLPHDINKYRCLRYFQDLAPKENDDRFTLGENVSTTRCDPILYFKPELRATPSFSSSAANTFSLYHAGISRDCTSISLDSINNTGGNLLCGVSSGLNAGGASQVLTNGTATQCFFDSEL